MVFEWFSAHVKEFLTPFFDRREMKIQDLQNGDLSFTVGQILRVAAAIRQRQAPIAAMWVSFDGEIYHKTQDKE